MFKHKLGERAESIVTGLRGILTARSENLNMCVRYFIQPRVDKDMQQPDGYWVDENEVMILLDEKGKVEDKNEKEKDKGGPMSKIR
jgi:hypothetical protein